MQKNETDKMYPRVLTENSWVCFVGLYAEILLVVIKMKGANMKTRKDGDDQEGEKREADLWDKMCYEISLGLHPQCTIEEVREKVAKRLVRRG